MRYLQPQSSRVVLGIALVAVASLIIGCDDQNPPPPPAEPAAITAQDVRDGAGVQEGETVGPHVGVIPGAPAGIALTPSPTLTIESRADAQSLSTSGDGSAETPFVIDGLSIDAAADSAAFGFRWNDVDADYFITLRNSEVTGASTALVFLSTGSRLEIANTTLALGAEGVRVARGSLEIAACRFDGLAGDGIRTVGADDPIEVELRDCEFSDSLGPWSGDSKGIQSTSQSRNVRIDVSHTAFDAASLDTGVRTWRDAQYVIANCSFSGRLGIRGGTEDVRGLVVKNCIFRVRQNAIRGELFVDFEIAHCDFRDNEAGSRIVRFDDCDTGRVHHCKFTKTTGEGPGNECLETFDSRDVEFDHNWVTTCSEDAFEHVRPRGHCSVHHCVGDSVALQIVDYFGHHPDNGGSVHHIWGDCRDVGVLITDVDDISIHSIFTDNSLGRWGNVTLEQRQEAPGTHPSGCTVRPPLPSPEQSADGGPFRTQGEVGPGNSAIWVVDGEEQTFES